MCRGAVRLAAALTAFTMRADRLRVVAFAYIRTPATRQDRSDFISRLCDFEQRRHGELSGASVRYRFYSRWGCGRRALADRLLVLGHLLDGLFALGGLRLVTAPLTPLLNLPHGLVVAAGWALLCVPVAYLGAATRRRTTWRLWRLTVPSPSLPVASAQLALSIADWTLAGAVMYLLLPAGSLPFLGFLAIFLVSILLGMAIDVPGGLGVFERDGSPLRQRLAKTAPALAVSVCLPAAADVHCRCFAANCISGGGHLALQPRAGGDSSSNSPPRVGSVAFSQGGCCCSWECQRPQAHDVLAVCCPGVPRRTFRRAWLARQLGLVAGTCAAAAGATNTDCRRLSRNCKSCKWVRYEEELCFSLEWCAVPRASAFDRLRIF